MKTIREIWNEQSDEFNQFDSLGNDEIETFADEQLSKLRRCGNCRKWNPLNHECYDNAAYETYITERNHTCDKWELQP